MTILLKIDEQNYVSQSSEGLQIKSSNLDLSASNVQISSTEASMSLGARRDIVLDGKDDVSIQVGMRVNLESDPNVYYTSSGVNINEDPNLIGHWTFDDPDDPYKDITGNGNDGVHQGVDWVSQPESVFQNTGQNSILTKDNGGVLLLTHNAVKDHQQQTYGFWFKTAETQSFGADGDPDHARYPRIWSRDRNEYFAITTDKEWNEDGKMNIYVWNKTTDVNSDDCKTIENALHSGSWYYAALTLDYDENDMIFYLFDMTGSMTTSINENLKPANADTTPGSGASGRGVTIGCNNEYPTVPQETLSNWTGSIDDVRYYNRILTGDEVNELYQDSMDYSKHKISFPRTEMTNQY